jgi:hypothetical protein
MQPERVSAEAADSESRTQRFYTVDDANRSLVLVRRIVTDIVERYRVLQRRREEREEAATRAAAAGRVEQLTQSIEQDVQQLARLHDELSELGCELKDWSGGLVDFPALHENRKVYLCWRLGEPAVAHWHEVAAGFAGRQPIVDSALVTRAEAQAGREPSMPG